MTDLKDLLSDRDHAKKIIEQLAAVKLYDIDPNRPGTEKNQADNVLSDSIKEFGLDRTKVRNITYMETLFLLDNLYDGEKGRNGCGRLFFWEDYLFNIALFCRMVQSKERICPPLRIILATPFDTLFQALIDICDKESADRLWLIYRRIRVSYRSRCRDESKPDGKTTVKDVLSLFSTFTAKSWIPGTIAIIKYEREIREAYMVIGMLLIEMPVCAFYKRMEIEDILNKYRADEEPDFDENELCIDEEFPEEFPFN